MDNSMSIPGIANSPFDNPTLKRAYHQYNLPYQGFLLILCLFCIYAFFSIRDLRYETRILPQALMIGIILLSIVDGVISAGFVEVEKQKLLDMKNMASSDEVISTKILLVELIWLTLFIHGIYYVGFFSVTAAFVFLYIMTHETSPLKRRTLLASGWTIGLVSFTYVLFIHVMNVQIIFRLGFLP